MGIPLLAAAGMLILAGAMIIAKAQIKKIYRDVDSIIALAFLESLGMVFIAGATGDPLFESLPASFQLMGFGGMALAGFWKYFLQPVNKRLDKLESRVSHLEVEVRGIKERLSGIEADLHLIKVKLLG